MIKKEQKTNSSKRRKSRYLDKYYPGDLFIDKRDNDNNIYILSMVSSGKYCCISLTNGNRFLDPAEKIKDAIGSLTYINKNLTINIQYDN